MAKIGQLSPTFQPRNQNVMTPGVNLGGLGSGLQQASQNYMAALQVRENAQLQLSGAQATAATWQMRNFGNAFVLSLDNPAKIQELFGGGLFDEVVQGLGDGVDLMDSTVGQSVWRNAVEAASLQIEDESVRQEFFYQQMNLWEEIEPGYQAQADAFMQHEAAGLWNQTQQEMWSQGAWSGSIAYNSGLDDGEASGYFGADPLAARQAKEGYKLNTQKAEERAFQAKQYEQVLISMARSGAPEELIRAAALQLDMGSIAQADNTYKMDDKALNQVVAGGMLLASGGKALTPEEDEAMMDEWIDRALVTVDLVDHYQGLHTEAVESGNWAQVNTVMNRTYVDPETGEVMTVASGDAINAAEQLKRELTSKLGTSTGKFDSGVPWLGDILGDTHDDDTLNAQINKLNAFIKAGGNDAKSSVAGISAAEGIMQSGNSTSEKEGMLRQLGYNGDLSVADMKSYLQRQNTLVRQRAYNDSVRIFNQAIDPNSGPMRRSTPLEKSALAAQLNDFLESSGNLEYKDVLLGLESIADDYMADTKVLTGLMEDSLSENFRFYRTTLGGPKAYPLEAGRELTKLQNEIENQSLAGLVPAYSPMLAEYTTEMGRRFTLAFEKDLLPHVNPADFKLDEGGRPMIAGTVVDVYGRSLIALVVNDEAQSGRRAGTLRVKVYAPTVEDRGFINAMVSNIFTQEGRTGDTIGFYEYDAADDYMITAVNRDGDQDPWFTPEGQFREGAMDVSILGWDGTIDPATGSNVLFNLSYDPNSALSRSIGDTNE